MDEEQRAVMQVVVLYNASKGYGLVGNHKKAIETASDGIDICRRFKIGNVLPHLLYNYAWNKEQLIEKGVLSPENKRECINYLKQAYYIASAMQQSYIEKFIKSQIALNYDIIL